MRIPHGWLFGERFHPLSSGCVGVGEEVAIVDLYAGERS